MSPATLLGRRPASDQLVPLGPDGEPGGLLPGGLTAVMAVGQRLEVAVVAPAAFLTPHYMVDVRRQRSIAFWQGKAVSTFTERMLLQVASTYLAPVRG